uniref:Uncharacterized protein n=1 Tax=Physcomitrium patens TaxID=3218 RepID=A0A2K1KKR7_PHYPA|nr:hypothetical protein PHYPA_008046 [Physcomitrium patens]
MVLTDTPTHIPMHTKRKFELCTGGLIFGDGGHRVVWHRSVSPNQSNNWVFARLLSNSRHRIPHSLRSSTVPQSRSCIFPPRHLVQFRFGSL